MLVLTRKFQEKIHIGENITITVVRIKGNTVRVGIEAPPDVRVVRGEVAERDEAAPVTAAELEPAAGDQAAGPADVRKSSTIVQCVARGATYDRRTGDLGPCLAVPVHAV
jgi:carbon storage regulator CsrA